MTQGITAKRLIRILSVVLLFVVIVGYGIWGGKDLLFGIRLNITGIVDGSTLASSPIEFSGVSKRATNITVNGGPVSVGEDGEFHDTLALLPGYNYITVTASDKFGQTVTKKFTVYYPPPNIDTAPNEIIKEEKAKNETEEIDTNKENINSNQ